MRVRNGDVAVEPLVIEMLIESESGLPTVFPHNLKTHAIHQTELASVCGDKGSQPDFMLAFSNPFHYHPRQYFLT